ncbi:putative exported protease [Paramicrosporidium saccamoebae]|uniref:Putative exported protease n=1 Tax=Paramicrosporidium saccamoebae TaxID=1246581 RepID=A0A2H9TMS9_9FUNG|nr:putative exported protease [Paramicrosporidium saccamoebae]
MGAFQHEEKLRSLLPKVEWTKSQGLSYESVSIDSYQGAMRVPSSYDRPKSRSFTLGVRRLTVPGHNPSAHYIMLSGGPGSYPDVEIEAAQRLLCLSDGHMAIYVVDHRGLGASGEIVGENVTDSAMEQPGVLNRILKNAPFDVRDLILENASLDVSMLGLAIQNDPLFNAGNRLVLWGFSYGSQWANHTIQLTPMLFDAAVLGGVPKIKGTPSPITSLGLAENCAQDDFCRSKMGGNVLDTLERAARSIVEPNFNSCTRLFHDQFPMIGHTGERVALLSGMLGALLLEESAEFQQWRDFRSSQLVLPFIKATYDCIDAQLYRDAVLRPMTPLITRLLDIQSGKALRRNQFVNTVVRLDMDHGDFEAGPPEFKTDYKNLHPFEYRSMYYLFRWAHLEPFLKGRKLSKERPLISPKTEVYVVASRMDTVTPYLNAWDYFEAIKVPKKHWMLFENRPHDGHECDCTYMAITMAASGNTAEFDWESCIRNDNAFWKVDWTFSNLPDEKRMWDAVADATNKQLVLKNVPIHQTKVFTGTIEAPLDPSDGISKSTMLLAAGFGIFALIAAVIIIWRIGKAKRSRAESPVQP